MCCVALLRGQECSTLCSTYMEKVKDLDSLTLSDNFVGRSKGDSHLVDFTAGMKSVENHPPVSAGFKGPECSVWTRQSCSTWEHNTETSTGKYWGKVAQGCLSLGDWKWDTRALGCFRLCVTLEFTHQEACVTQLANRSFTNAARLVLIPS